VESEDELLGEGGDVTGQLRVDRRHEPGGRGRLGELDAPSDPADIRSVRRSLSETLPTDLDEPLSLVRLRSRGTCARPRRETGQSAGKAARYERGTYMRIELGSEACERSEDKLATRRQRCRINRHGNFGHGWLC
jgi:hypothetical protein